jgi:hypothetical protein
MSLRLANNGFADPTKLPRSLSIVSSQSVMRDCFFTRSPQPLALFSSRSPSAILCPFFKLAQDSPGRHRQENRHGKGAEADSWRERCEDLSEPASGRHLR